LTLKEEYVTLPVKELNNLANNILKKRGLSIKKTKIVVDELFDAELRGRSTHGISFLPRILNELSQKKDEIKIIQENEYSAFIDGGDNLGSIVSNFCAQLAIEKAKNQGIAIIAAINKFTFITPGYYARMISKQDLISILMSSSGQHVAAWGGRDPILGTNPLAFGFPTKSEPIIGDLSTAAMPALDIREAKRKQKTIPSGRAVDKLGNLTNDPAEALNGAQLVFGGHKGYCINLMIEILTSSLLGINKLDNQDKKCGMLFIVINPKIFGFNEEFKVYVSELSKTIRNSKKAKGFDEVLVPGDKGTKKFKEFSKTGINIRKELIKELKSFT
jgi:L-2-hydroxycarboxylate dehydrogenase (NAD+)